MGDVCSVLIFCSVSPFVVVGGGGGGEDYDAGGSMSINEN
jgi:hypothetical protein